MKKDNSFLVFIVCTIAVLVVGYFFYQNHVLQDFPPTTTAPLTVECPSCLTAEKGAIPDTAESVTKEDKPVAEVKVSNSVKITQIKAQITDDAITSNTLIALINLQRLSLNLGTVSPHPYLTQIAQAKADDLAAHSLFSHADSEGMMIWKRVDENVYAYKGIGENLAVEFTSASGLVKAWVNSPTHYEVMTKSFYTDVGIGIAKGTFNGQPDVTFVVAVFGSR